MGNLWYKSRFVIGKSSFSCIYPDIFLSLVISSKTVVGSLILKKEDSQKAD